MLEKLAKQTAIYGISTILGRMLSYLLTPFYTRIFGLDAYGIITDVYALIPFALVVLTLGGAGSCCMKDGVVYRQDIVPVKAVDTTAAGDTFTGFFLHAYLGGQSVPDALSLAARASSITVSRPGAADSIPTMAELLG